MTEIDEISARLTVLETVVRQLITHMAVRTEDPPGWVRTRRVLAARALEVSDAGPMYRATLIRDAMSSVFDQAEQIVKDYGRGGTPRAVLR